MKQTNWQKLRASTEALDKMMPGVKGEELAIQTQAQIVSARALTVLAESWYPALNGLRPLTISNR